MLAKSKPDIMEVIRSKFKNLDNTDNPEQFTKQEINALLNESDHSDQNDVSPVDMQVFKARKNYSLDTASLDLDNIELYQNDGFSWPSQSRRRHISESGIEIKNVSNSGSMMYSSHSNSLDMLPRIDQVRTASSSF